MPAADAGCAPRLPAERVRLLGWPSAAPKFDPAASDAAAYGAIGAIIGHDVTHFVDVLGAEYDASGATRRWWTGDDMLRFEAAAEPLVTQFSGYHPFADMSVDGKLTRTENVADLGGLVAAFDAYRERSAAESRTRSTCASRTGSSSLPSRRAGAARAARPGCERSSQSDHAPEEYRVSTVRNLDAWYDAFDVRPGPGAVCRAESARADLVASSRQRTCASPCASFRTAFSVGGRVGRALRAYEASCVRAGAPAGARNGLSGLGV